MEESVQRKRVKELETIVADVVSETPDTVTVVLFTGNDHLDYKPGHFLTIDPHQFEALARFTAFLEDLKGHTEPPRAYTMSSSPDEKYLAVTIKEERYIPNVTKYPPLLSPLLVKHVKPGLKIHVTGFTGPFTIDDAIRSNTNHLVHICAGSGSVPSFSILKYALKFHSEIHHTFLYSNKKLEDVIFKKELDDLQKRFPEKLEVIHSLTRESDSFPPSATLRRGRITKELIASTVSDGKNTYFYLCGPAISPYDRKVAKEKGVEPAPRFMETVLAHLNELGIPKEKIKKESFG